MSLIGRRRWLQAVAALAPLTLGLSPLQAQSTPWRERKRRVRVRGLDMAYYEVGEGNPIVFLHGNPTSSYLWRNIIPHVQTLGRCIAPDLIGMGDSDPLPDSGPGRYTFLTHRDYLFDMFERLELGNRVTFVVHDWGSALGFTWAQRNPQRVRGLAHMEAIIEPPNGPRAPAPAPGSTFAIYRSMQGEQAVLRENRFVENLINGLGYYLTPEDAAEYRRPYLTPGESRRPTLEWPQQLPLGGEPKETHDVARSYSDWLAAASDHPKLFVRVNPGALVSRPEVVEFVRSFKNQTEVTVFGSHWVQEIAPDAIGRALAAWLQKI